MLILSPPTSVYHTLNRAYEKPPLVLHYTRASWREVGYEFLKGGVFVVPTIFDYCGVWALDCAETWEVPLLVLFDDLGSIQSFKGRVPHNNLVE